mgnify:CR=1 FL=1
MKKTHIVVAFTAEHPAGKAVALTTDREEAMAAYNQAAANLENEFVGYASLSRWEKREKPAVAQARILSAAARHAAAEAIGSATAETGEEGGEKSDEDEASVESSKPKRRGRPPGSKSKEGKASAPTPSGKDDGEAAAEAIGSATAETGEEGGEKSDEDEASVESIESDSQF